jgi:purine nucleosidase
LFSGRKVNVVVETAGIFTTGMSVVDWWGVTNRPQNAMFLREVDVEGFYALLTERLGRLP